MIPRNERPALIDVHGRIAEAISHGDMDTAQRLMHDHMQELAARAEQRNPGLMQEIVDWRCSDLRRVACGEAAERECLRLGMGCDDYGNYEVTSFSGLVDEADDPDSLLEVSHPDIVRSRDEGSGRLG